MSPKRPRAPRVKLPSEVPLDDGQRRGTETWRELGGVAFCHWDRWLLRLALDEPHGFASITEKLKRRTLPGHHVDHAAEALLAQLCDLESRLAQLGLSPAGVLDKIERESTWLHAKALRRVWESDVRYETEAMQRTPRKLLEARAQAGHWAAFPVSPKPYFERLARLYRAHYFDYRGVSLIVGQLEREGDEMMKLAANDAERLAVRRAMLGACIDAMGHVDDSGAELGDCFREQEQAYLAQLSGYIAKPGILRDLLELATWEAYGLFHHIEGFLKALTGADADRAVLDLEQLIQHLREAQLEYQLGSWAWSRGARAPRRRKVGNARHHRAREPVRR